MTQSLPMEYFVTVTLLCHLLEAQKMSSIVHSQEITLLWLTVRLILMCSIFPMAPNWFQVNLSQGTFFSILKFSIGNTSKRKLMRKALREFTPDFHRIQGFLQSIHFSHSNMLLQLVTSIRKHHFHSFPNLTQCQGHRRRKKSMHSLSSLENYPGRVYLFCLQFRDRF